MTTDERPHEEWCECYLNTDPLHPNDCPRCTCERRERERRVKDVVTNARRVGWLHNPPRRQGTDRRTSQPIRYAGSTDPDTTEERVLRGVESAERGESVEFEPSQAGGGEVEDVTVRALAEGFYAQDMRQHFDRMGDVRPPQFIHASPKIQATYLDSARARLRERTQEGSVAEGKTPDGEASPDTDAPIDATGPEGDEVRERVACQQVGTDADPRSEKLYTLAEARLKVAEELEAEGEVRARSSYRHLAGLHLTRAADFLRAHKPPAKPDTGRDRSQGAPDREVPLAGGAGEEVLAEDWGFLAQMLTNPRLSDRELEEIGRALKALRALAETEEGS